MDSFYELKYRRKNLGKCVDVIMKNRAEERLAEIKLETKCEHDKEKVIESKVDSTINK